MKYFILLMIIINFCYSSENEIINLEKRITNLEYHNKNIEREMLFLNENLKKIDKNFQIIISIINNNNQSFPLNNRIKPVKLFKEKLTTSNNIYTIINNGKIYRDKQGLIILDDIFKGEIVDIENCPCQTGDICFCKIKNKNAYIKSNLIKKEGK